MVGESDVERGREDNSGYVAVFGGRGVVVGLVAKLGIWKRVDSVRRIRR